MLKSRDRMAGAQYNLALVCYLVKLVSYSMFMQLVSPCRGAAASCSVPLVPLTLRHTISLQVGSWNLFVKVRDDGKAGPAWGGRGPALFLRASPHGQGLTVCGADE